MKHSTVYRLALAGVLSIGATACLLPTEDDTNICRQVTIPALSGDTVTLPSGVKYIERSVGTGDTARVNSNVTLSYDGYLTDGTYFDNGRAASFSLAGTIAGFRDGVAGMRVGGIRRLIIPANQGYGAQPVRCIPANSTLIFDVQLERVHR